MVRRLVAGVVLIALGFALLGSQVSQDPERLVFGFALLLLWGSAGLGVILGRSWGRWLGLAVAAVGLCVALWEGGQSGPDGNRFLVDVYFLADGPNFSWMETGVASAAFAALSALAGVLLLLPFAPRAQTDVGSTA